MVISLFAAATLPAAASAAECTDTWTGPVEGTWQTAGNWSAGHVPTETDVACIGAGKTAKVTEGSRKAAIVQGEGTLAISAGTMELTRPPSEGVSVLASLALSGGTLTGPGTIEVSKTLLWTHTSTMSGTGTTKILSGASAEAKTGLVSEKKLTQRQLVNEGTFTLVEGNIVGSEGAEIVNVGTFNANSEKTPAITTGAGSGFFINNGTFRKTAGTGPTQIAINFENNGTVGIQKGKLTFTGGGLSSSSSQWEAGEGLKIGFSSIAYLLGGSITGSAEVSGGTVTPQGVLAAENFILGEGGTINGSNTLQVSKSLQWNSTSTMSGIGKTIILPGASAEAKIGVLGEKRLTQRQLVNEGTFTLVEGNIVESEGAEIVNLGIFNANSGRTPTIETTKGNARVLNMGLFQKAAGTGPTLVTTSFENHGRIAVLSGKLTIENPITVSTSNHFGKHSKCGDPVDCATGDYSETQTDLAIGGRGVGLDLTRTYSAKTAAAASSPGAFGYGWSSSFSDHLTAEESGKKITLVQGDGGTVPFTESGKGSYVPAGWSQDTLSGSSEAGYTLVLPEQTKYKFSGGGRLESVTDRNGNETTLGYDESGHLKTIANPAGRQITLTYNSEGFVESAKDPMGHVVKYTYESKNLKTVTLPGEASPNWQFKYDTSHRITSITDGRSGKTTNEYDSSSRVISQTDPAGRTLTFKYEAFHTTITNKATGAVTDEWFTSNNEPFQITRGYGTSSATIETFSYNEAGQLVAVTDGNGHTTAFGYDAQGNKTSEKDAAGHERKWTYNGTHDVLSETTPRGETTTIERDGNGNVESVSRPGPEETTQTTTFSHDEYGQLESVTDPLERTWTYGYDAQGDRTSESDPLGNAQTLGYDEDSRLTSIVTPRGNVEGAGSSEYEITVERDARGRPLKVTDPLGHATEYAYDGNGNLTAKTDPNGHTTKYVYNADDEQIKTEKPNGAVLETGYDGAGQVTSQTDANKQTTTYVRNAVGQPVEVIDPLGRKTVEEFDPAGNLEALIDPAERKTSYVYDAANRLTEVNYSEEATPDASFEYDADGNVTSMADGTGESSFSYDQLGRLTASEDGHGDIVGYGYDLAEQLTAIAYPNGKSIARAFDGAGRLESVTDWLGGTTSFTYDADSNLEEIIFPVGSGNVDEYAYNRADRMSEAKFSRGIETLATLSYSRDKVGQVEGEAREGLPGPEELSYGYDKNNRLIEAGEASFEYDAADNLTKGLGSTNTYDAASQLETGTSIGYSYDKLGERIKATPGAGPATTYSYDQAGNLISVERPEEGEVLAITESFAYDASGLLTSKTSGLTTHYLAWDSSAALPLLLDDGQNSYLYGPNGLPIEQISSEEEPTYLHHDQLGSTRLLTDASGEASATFSYAPYGGLEGRAGTATTPLGFAGQYTDDVSGLQYLRARFYDPATAQFLSHDPIAAVTRAPYGYGGENPLSFVDPSGMSCTTSAGAGLGISIPVVSNPVDCAKDAIGAGASEAGNVVGDTLNFGLDHVSLLAAPLVFTACIYEPEWCSRAVLAGAGGTITANGLQAATEPCFNFWPATLRDLLVTIAAALPGGVFEATAGRYGPELGPVARRIIQTVLDAPGLGAELAHGARGP